MVGGTHVQSVRGTGAQLPCRIQRVQLAALVDGCLRVGIVACEALVGVAVVDDGLWEGSARKGSSKWRGISKKVRRCYNEDGSSMAEHHSRWSNGGRCTTTRGYTHLCGCCFALF